ncbi:Fungal specific transcription factor [Conoideocrella luteorostrata]|uniref:Fungal specific transcription factor n=1 Tax=Conoideocrella luteorostrata TaxID=1105319 RepID=A0AAJ0CNV6_9HYPO|nr:Fungal specific transcription factor [Conoideocrella luteorostrata]
MHILERADLSISSPVYLTDAGSGIAEAPGDSTSTSLAAAIDGDSLVASQTDVTGDTTPSPQNRPIPRPRILSNTLGLDLNTHAEYVGLTDCLEPVLLDLHRPEGTASSHIATASSRHTFARRLDHRTSFLVHSDGLTASDTQRVVDLDLIEDAVRPLGRALVDLYFRVVHPSFPILHKGVFISKHRSSHRHFAPSLLAAVYLVALDWHLYDSSLAGYETEVLPDIATLEKLADRTIAQDMRRPKLSTLEAGLLLLQRHRSKTDGSSCAHGSSSRTFTAQLVAMAQDLGIHIDCSSWNIPPWEIGLRRRLGWALYMQDRWGACAHGRPFLIHHNDWDVKMCSNSDYPELEEAVNRWSDSDSNIATGWEIFLKHVELTRIMSEVHETFYSGAATRAGGTWDREGILAAVDMAKPLILRLREWYENLPRHLHMEAIKSRGLCANGAIHLAYMSVEVTLYRALVRNITPDTPADLHQSLRSAARRKVQDVVSLMESLRPEHTAAFWGSAASYQAAEGGSLAGLLWATADSAEEMSWCSAQIEDLRWALRVRGAAAAFAREALHLIERDVGGLGIVKMNTEYGERC